MIRFPFSRCIIREELVVRRFVSSRLYNLYKNNKNNTIFLFFFEKKSKIIDRMLRAIDENDEYLRNKQKHTPGTGRPLVSKCGCEPSRWWLGW